MGHGSPWLTCRQRVARLVHRADGSRPGRWCTACRWWCAQSIDDWAPAWLCRHRPTHVERTADERATHLGLRPPRGARRAVGLRLVRLDHRRGPSVERCRATPGCCLSLQADATTARQRVARASMANHATRTGSALDRERWCRCNRGHQWPMGCSSPDRRSGTAHHARLVPCPLTRLGRAAR